MPRASTTRTTRRASVRSTTRQPGIQSFARATKPGTRTSIGPADEKKIQEKQTPLLPSSPSKKRKLSEIGQAECVREEDVAKDVTATPSKTLRFSELALSTPRRTKSAPSRGLRRRETLREESPSRTPSIEEESSTGPEELDTRPTSPEDSSPVEEQTSPITRPASFNDLLSLHSCFLTALSLHYAHNGTSTPPDLKEFLPSVQKVWKKRKVVTKDLQRLVQIWDEEESARSAGVRFRIANYGLGKVCLERVVESGQTAGPLDENELQIQFERRLDRVWKRLVDSIPDVKVNNQVDFLDLLDLAPIHESLTAFTSFRKGQQRLQDLRGGVIRVKTAMLKAKTEIDETPKGPVVAATARRKGLLDRIKSKELRQSKLPPPPSKEMLLRRSAAERVEEVARVLMVLRPSGAVGIGPWAIAASQKKSYSVDSVVQNVQDSVRSPISDKEVEVCLDILTRKDIAGNWVKMVTVNELRSVVLGSSRDISPTDIGAKVTALKIGWEEHTLY